MKNNITHLTFLIAVILLPFAANAKKEKKPFIDTIPKKLTIDFSKKYTPDLTQLNNIKEGDFYQVIIKNINTNLYNITLAAKDTFYQSSVKATPDFTSITTDAIKSLVSNISPASLTQAIAGPFEMMAERAIGPRTDNPPPPPPAVKSGATKDIQDAQDAEKNHLTGYVATLDKIKSTIDNLMYEIYVYQLKAGVEDNLSTLYTSLNNGVINVPATLNLVKEQRNHLSSLLDSVLRTSAAYTAFSGSDKYKTEIHANATFLANDGYITAAYTQLLTVINSVDTATAPPRILSTMAGIISLENTDARTFTSLPIQFKNDQAQVSINIDPIAKGGNLQSYSMPLVFPLYKRFYVAVGVSLYGSGLHNDAYSIVNMKKDTVTVDSIVKENPGKQEFGVASLIRFGYKLYKNEIGIHATFGPGVSVSNSVRARVLYGAGLSFGKQNMITIDAGWITGYVDRISNAVSADRVYPSPVPSIIVSQLNTGGFISLGYLYEF